jgi:hypothetical protein
MPMQPNDSTKRLIQPLPQMFRLRTSGIAEWEYGMLSPVRDSFTQCRATWSRRGEAFSLQLRPELLRQFIGDPGCFEWVNGSMKEGK